MRTRLDCEKCGSLDHCSQCCAECQVCGWTMNLHAVDSDEVFVDGRGFVPCDRLRDEREQSKQGVKP